jgi:hypothetical protein
MSNYTFQENNILQHDILEFVSVPKNSLCYIVGIK